MSISESIQRAKQTLFNNLQVRRYYGKKYYRQTTRSAGGGAQTRYTANKAGSSKGRFSQSTTGIIQSQKIQIINDKLSADQNKAKG
jgi:hypothetical protein